MSNIVLKAENISKQYRLGQMGTGTLSHDINRWWHKIRGKEDPYLKIGDVNDRSKAGGGDYVWSLKDIDFEIKRGDLVGIIGKNGAGKSTLLKILSQVTTPTTGQIKTRGRIAALLEVGTGFHPDLSGRENIFLNGAILGMTKIEIKSKLDEIVDFSGVAKYLDTPVKRYSSGMMVRLGFAVAAHLEPEILIVDEVLAVGDAEFQKKCLGKMKDVSGQGRTVLYVSHNMPSIKSLCTTAFLLDKGKIVDSGNVDKIVKKYLNNSEIKHAWFNEAAGRKDSRNYSVTKIDLASTNGTNMNDVFISEDFYIRIFFTVHEECPVSFSVIISNEEGIEILSTIGNTEPVYYGKRLLKGNYVSAVKINGNLLNDIKYSVTVVEYGTSLSNPLVIENALAFECTDDGKLKGDYSGGYGGLIRPSMQWQTKRTD